MPLRSVGFGGAFLGRYRCSTFLNAMLSGQKGLAVTLKLGLSREEPPYLEKFHAQ